MKTPFIQVQENLIRAQICLPVLGIIPAAIQIIVSVGEFIHARKLPEATSEQREMKQLCYKEAEDHLKLALANILSIGLLIPIYTLIYAIDDRFLNKQ